LLSGQAADKLLCAHQRCETIPGFLTSPRRCAKKLPMYVNWEGKDYVFEKPMLVSRLLQELKVSAEGHLVVANNRLVTEDHRLDADDSVKVIRVVSGG